MVAREEGGAVGRGGFKTCYDLARRPRDAIRWTEIVSRKWDEIHGRVEKGRRRNYPRDLRPKQIAHSKTRPDPKVYYSIHILQPHPILFVHHKKTPTLRWISVEAVKYTEIEWHRYLLQLELIVSARAQPLAIYSAIYCGNYASERENHEAVIGKNIHHF